MGSVILEVFELCLLTLVYSKGADTEKTSAAKDAFPFLFLMFQLVRMQAL